ncbi:MAG: aminoglycoside phosphotransferase family protein [Phycisphaerales bacterium]|nr:aminoglycoside phosphotransferase family protein [Phycisphaerales bacterium]
MSTIPSSLACSLEPVLKKQTNNKLSDIHWFRTDWQRGGAATGFATWENQDNSQSEVVIKLPVVEKELRWTRRMQDAGGVAPLLFSSGEQLNGYDLAWMVIERFPVGPLGKRWDKTNIKRIADAAARFTLAATEYQVDQDGRKEDWKTLLSVAKKSVRENHIENESKWKKAHSLLSKKLDSIIQRWRSRRIDQWLHGDLHFANAMCRNDDPNASVALIDLAEVHAGHWIEDAVYLERQLWGHKTRLKESKPIQAMAKARKQLDMRVDDDYIELVDIRRLLLAATAPSFMQSEGDPRYLASCLQQFQGAADRLHLK